MKFSELSSSLAHKQCACPGSHPCQPWLLGTQSISHRPGKGGSAPPVQDPWSPGSSKQASVLGEVWCVPGRIRRVWVAAFSWRLSFPAELKSDPAHDVQQRQQRLRSCAAFRHSHPRAGRGVSQAVFTHSQTCFCWSDQLMLLNHPDLCVLTSPVVFLHPRLFSSCLTSQPEEFHAVERARSHAAGQSPPHPHMADWVSGWAQVRESTSLSAAEKKLSTHKHSSGECFPGAL